MDPEAIAAAKAKAQAIAAAALTPQKRKMDDDSQQYVSFFFCFCFFVFCQYLTTCVFTCLYILFNPFRPPVKVAAVDNGAGLVNECLVSGCLILLRVPVASPRA